MQPRAVRRWTPRLGSSQPDLLRGQQHAAHADGVAVGGVGLVVQQHLGEAAHVGLELGGLGGGVALAHDGDVHAAVGVAGHGRIHGDDARRRRVAPDVPVGRVDLHAEEVGQAAVLLPRLQAEEHRRHGAGHQHRLVVGAGHAAAGRGGGLPLAEVGIEAPGPDHVAAGGVLQLGVVAAQVQVVHQVHPAAGPGALQPQLVQGDDLLVGIAGVEVVDAQGLVPEVPVEGRGVRGQDRGGDHRQEGAEEQAAADTQGHDGLPGSLLGESAEPGDGAAAAVRSQAPGVRTRSACWPPRPGPCRCRRPGRRAAGPPRPAARSRPADPARR